MRQAHAPITSRATSGCLLTGTSSRAWCPITGVSTMVEISGPSIDWYARDRLIPRRSCTESFQNDSSPLWCSAFTQARLVTWIAFLMAKQPCPAERLATSRVPGSAAGWHANSCIPGDSRIFRNWKVAIPIGSSRVCPSTRRREMPCPLPGSTCPGFSDEPETFSVTGIAFRLGYFGTILVPECIQGMARSIPGEIPQTTRGLGRESKRPGKR